VPAEDDRLRLHELIPAIVDRLPAILAEVGELLAERHPDYARFLAEEFDGVAAAAEGFTARLVSLAERDPLMMAPELKSGVEQALFEELGRMHWQQQRDVTNLLAAYRTGAAVAWRHVADAALRLGVPAEAFAGLAAAVFAAVDQLSSASLRGYVRAQATAAGYGRERLRDELAELLLSDRSDTAAVRAAAARAGWSLPQQAAVVLIAPDKQVARMQDRLDDSCLRLQRPQMLVAIVPDPSGPGRRKRLETALRGAAAVVGATVPLDRLPSSVGLAELDPLFVDEHLDAMVVHRDHRLLAALRQQYLAPLAQLPAPTRDRLSETLRSWLMNMGNRKAVADELHVHPQTVRYRLGRLRELFGSALDEPATRAALLLALAWGPAVPESDPLAPRTASR
jgi:hypothetical protein